MNKTAKEREREKKQRKRRRKKEKTNEKDSFKKAERRGVSGDLLSEVEN